MAESKSWYLVSYDIRKPARWRRVFKLLKSYGHSLQYSIFRCRLNRRALERMRWELEKILAPEDRLFIAGLCASCLAKLILHSVEGEKEWVRVEPRYRIL